MYLNSGGSHAGHRPQSPHPNRMINSIRRSFTCRAPVGRAPYVRRREGPRIFLWWLLVLALAVPVARRLERVVFEFRRVPCRAPPTESAWDRMISSIAIVHVQARPACTCVGPYVRRREGPKNFLWWLLVLAGTIRASSSWLLPVARRPGKLYLIPAGPVQGTAESASTG